MSQDAPLLRVRDLRTWLATGDAIVRAVDGVSFDVQRGETFALVGESGCGKSMTALSIMRLLPDAGGIVGGSVELDGRDLLQLPESGMRDVRGRRIGMIFQEPALSLNPVMTAGEQIAEALRRHIGLQGAALEARVLELLEAVRIPEAARRKDEYPFLLSGGMKQRVMIAMALACDPELLIADEPTTGLDATIQARIVELLGELKGETGITTLLISHDISVIRRLSDRVAVMYAGTVVETGAAPQVLRPHATERHPYTAALLASIPSAEAVRSKSKLQAIEGEVPDTIDLPRGCRFYGRCNRVTEAVRDRCANLEPPLAEVAPGHKLRCWLHAP